MDPTVWGPKLWFALHTITFVYPKNPTINDKKYYYDFFDNLKNVIPCDLCKQHYKQHLQNNPIMPHLNSQDSLIKWLIHLHNEVNISLGKKVYSYNEVMDIYKIHYNDKTETTSNNRILKFSIIIIILALILTFYFKIYKKKKIF